MVALFLFGMFCCVVFGEKNLLELHPLMYVERLASSGPWAMAFALEQRIPLSQTRGSSGSYCVIFLT